MRSARKAGARPSGVPCWAEIELQCDIAHYNYYTHNKQ